MARLLVGVNGFGRIGRLTARAAFERGQLRRFNAVADMVPSQSLAHILKYDSIHGNFKGHVLGENGKLLITKVGPLLGEVEELSLQASLAVMPGQKSPADLNWQRFKEVGDKLVVIEATGKFTDGAEARKHLDAGADWVIVTAPATNPDFTVVMGVNDDRLAFNSHKIISNASCTTNCLAPVAKPLHDAFGIKNGRMLTVHAYTADQPIQDAAHRKDPRRSFAGPNTMVPTSTGAAKAIGLVIPELDGRLDGEAIRVPLQNVSLVILDVNLEKSARAKDVNDVLREASARNQRILGFTTEAVASCVFNHDPRSSIVDGAQTSVDGKGLAHVLAWYDNEWGFSNRVVDLIEKLATHVEK